MSRTALAACACALALLAAPRPAARAEDAPWKAVVAQYEKLAKNHDDDASRERRLVLLDLFPFRTEKAVRKLMHEAYDDEKGVDGRTTVVYLLGGSGDPKDLEFLLGAFRKEKARAPVIALGEALDFTPEEARPAVAAAALKALPRAKGDLRVALIEGLGALGDASAVETLKDLEPKEADERFERNLALGRCGGEAVVPLLRDAAAGPDGAARLGAVLGLAATRCDAGWEAVRAALRDLDPRVVRAAAAELAAAGRKEAAPDLATALGGANALRTREELRAALRTLLGRDLGYDAPAWASLAAGESPPEPASLPQLPTFFGIPVASDASVVLIDTTRSMDWMGRLERAKLGCTQYVDAQADQSLFALCDVSRVPEWMEGGFVAGAAGRAQAHAWIDARLTRGGGDVEKALVETLQQFPAADTLVFATDSSPVHWETRSGRETLEILRRLGRTLRVRIHVALVMPGGRYEASERTEGEIEERIIYLRELAEDTGGSFVHVLE